MSSVSDSIQTAATGQRKEEKLFLIIVLALAAVAGIGSWLAASALARHDQLRGLPPDKPRQLEKS